MMSITTLFHEKPLKLFSSLFSAHVSNFQALMSLVEEVDILNENIRFWKSGRIYCMWDQIEIFPFDTQSLLMLLYVVCLVHFVISTNISLLSCAYLTVLTCLWTKILDICRRVQHTTGFLSFHFRFQWKAALYHAGNALCWHFIPSSLQLPSSPSSYHWLSLVPEVPADELMSFPNQEIYFNTCIAAWMWKLKTEIWKAPST